MSLNAGMADLGFHINSNSNHQEPFFNSIGELAMISNPVASFQFTNREARIAKAPDHQDPSLIVH